ncbi:Isoprenylcysteine carboxyl methyltransferase (ICMT) family protein [Rubripirellula lacrimiformis]|uniref:Isoprenylcysteine carboxyl methyltransferase (ICMT) family protein n=1 Tax=Rubripirellula lacrimiformis TaxID=1930273 RepID=A0A517N4N2_9BACT|nr:methyltransferase [Rubripirellula lacrimiformis]QDT02093.1 Isoprenylcysteine carboxyl methyltransferase (ICMT) family protein [Rubripirellula lacrimiformis]
MRGAYHAILISGQFVSSAILVMSATWSPFPFHALLIASPGIVLAVWAWFTMGLLRLRVGPGTTQQTRLVRSGPYAVVRHPMYVGLLWFTAAWLPFPLAWWRSATWLMLLIILIAKTREEEKAMCDRFDQYPSYRDQVGGLFPKLPTATRSG